MSAESPESGSLKDRIMRLVARRVAESLRDSPEALARLDELGIVDAEWLADPDADPGRPLERLRALKDEVAENPSLLSSMGVRPVALLGAQAEAVADARLETPAEGDVTVVFTDLEGFTTFTEERGDRRSSEVLRAHYATVDEIAAGRGGLVVKRLGDGHMITFATPQAAVLAALELVGARPDALRLRAGGHRGSVVRLGDDVVGHTVNLASRVTATASGGHVRVTLPVRDGAGEPAGARFGSPVEIALKGIDEPVAVCEVERV